MSNELTDQERLDMYEMNRLEGNEIKGEHLNELEAKGYEIVSHGDEVCFWCTINLLIGGLPDRNPSPSPPSSCTQRRGETMNEEKPYKIIATVTPLEFWLCVAVFVLVALLVVLVAT